MSTATMNPQSANPAATRYRVTFPNLLKSELIKITTVRSTMWSLSMAFAMIVGFGVIMAFATRTSSFDFGSDPAGLVAPILGVAFAQLVFVVLSVLSIGSEYSTGMIRSTLTAAPSRTPALLAKMGIMWLVTFLVSLVSIFLAFFLVQAIYTNPAMKANIGDSDSLQILLGGALFLSLISVFALAVGAIIRSTAGGIAIVLGLLLVVPGILSMIPWEWLRNVRDYLPDVGQSILSSESTNGHSPWGGMAILAVWTVVTSIIALVSIKRRDA